jgi:UV DNA damage repair endonuclease
VRAGAIRDLELQAELMDAIGLGPEAAVVLHVGGAAGVHEAGMDRFLAGFERLSERARERLVIENDDRTYSSPTCSPCTSAPGCAWSGTSCTTTRRGAAPFG